MHGSTLTLLKRYVQTQYDHSTWGKLMELSGLENIANDYKTVCPNEHTYPLVDHAAEMTGPSAGELHEKFGEYLVPDLMCMYQKPLKPEWKILDALEHTEPTKRKQMRQKNIQNPPPVPYVRRLGTNELVIDYVPMHRMSGLAVGIMRSLVAYYDEADHINVPLSTFEESERVRIHVRRH